MPLREYSCNKCKCQFETLERAGSRSSCPECGATEITKKLSVFGFASSQGFVSSSGSSCGGCSKNSCSGCSK